MMVDSYNIPWLVWIQMFVFFLLLLLVFVFGIVSSEIGDNICSSCDSVPSTSGSSLSRRYFSGDPISISHHGLGFSVNSSLVQSNQVTLNYLSLSCLSSSTKSWNQSYLLLSVDFTIFHIYRTQISIPWPIQSDFDVFSLFVQWGLLKGNTN